MAEVGPRPLLDCSALLHARLYCAPGTRTQRPG